METENNQHIQDQISDLWGYANKLAEEVDDLRKEPDIHYYSALPGFELKYSKEGDAGFDLPIFDYRLTSGEFSTDGSYVLQPGESMTFYTGTYIGLPKNWYSLADTRSGTSNFKLDLLCRTIDGCYRGELRVALVNLNSEPITIRNGVKLFQVVIVRHAVANPIKHNSVEEFIKGAGETERMANGFNSSGGGLDGI